MEMSGFKILLHFANIYGGCIFLLFCHEKAIRIAISPFRTTKQTHDHMTQLTKSDAPFKTDVDALRFALLST